MLELSCENATVGKNGLKRGTLCSLSAQGNAGQQGVATIEGEGADQHQVAERGEHVQPQPEHDEQPKHSWTHYFI